MKAATRIFPIDRAKNSISRCSTDAQDASHPIDSTILAHLRQPCALASSSVRCRNVCWNGFGFACHTISSCRKGLILDITDTKHTHKHCCTAHGAAELLREDDRGWQFPCVSVSLRAMLRALATYLVFFCSVIAVLQLASLMENGSRSVVQKSSGTAGDGSLSAQQATNGQFRAPQEAATERRCPGTHDKAENRDSTAKPNSQGALRGLASDNHVTRLSR